MGYTKKTWTTGDVITADDLNNLESGVKDASEIVGEVTTYSDTLTWDGNTDGLEAYGGMYYKISNIAPSVAELQTGNVSCASPDGYVNYNTNDAEEIDGAINCGEGCVLIVLEDTQVEGMTVTKGTYFISMSGAGYASSLTIPGQNIFPTTTTKKLTAEYLEPFEVTQVGGDTLTWDGDTSGLIGVMGHSYLISENAPTIEDFANGFKVNFFINGAIQSDELESSSVTSLGDALVIEGGLVLIVYADNYTNPEFGDVTFPKKGTYFSKIPNGMEMRSLTIPNYTGFVTTTKKLKWEYVSQPDFTQNDSSKPDYIKNRPFYMEESDLLEVNDYIFDINNEFSYIISPFNEEVSAGDLFIVNFDGEVYENEVIEFDGALLSGNQLLFNGIDNGVPYVIVIAPNGDTKGLVVMDFESYMEAMTTGNTELTSTRNFSITRRKYSRLDVNYIPNAIKTSDFDIAEGLTGSIKNKPLGRTLIYDHQWDGDIAGKETFDLGEIYNGNHIWLCKIQDEGINDFEAGFPIFTYTSDGSESSFYVMQSTNYGDRKGMKGYVCLHSTNNQANPSKSELALVSVWTNSTTVYGVSLTKGLYAAYEVSKTTGQIYKYVSSCKCYIVDKISDAYIPQSLRLLSIGLNEIVMHSSTSGSNKKFKITVDDAGTLTATEI